MVDIALFLETPTINIDDLTISDEILDAMLEPVLIDFETIDIHIFDI